MEINNCRNSSLAFKIAICRSIEIKFKITWTLLKKEAFFHHWTNRSVTAYQRIESPQLHLLPRRSLLPLHIAFFSPSCTSRWFDSVSIQTFNHVSGKHLSEYIFSTGHVEIPTGAALRHLQTAVSDGSAPALDVPNHLAHKIRGDHGMATHG